ncbi:Uncharacterized protein PECH_001835 [Penicillium ucsense]|uniref:Nucleoporin NUP188 n=1 Tax=Penicillium ucsense TaxID=2839758 RepID=A0A8J8WFD0_9EURO|nr:Uncharacterized protein PECM_001567 [Penicillium ucsense]KAF7732256.1 Uncharacterized protein PECH_001835 [Penicillium ucsense]
MAPVPEAYFPSLDKCFSGDTHLLSWRRAFIHSNATEIPTFDGGVITAFLSHPESIKLLSRSVKSFPEPSSQSKTEFSSKTAAIHSETNSSSAPNLQQIKADAQWLSEKAKIDEISALRIVVLEWQNRSSSRLTSTYSVEEAASLESVTGSDHLRLSVAGPHLTNILKEAAGTAEWNTFDDEASRRSRLRTLYLSERSHLLKTSRRLLALSHHNHPDQSSLVDAGKDGLSQIGSTLFGEKSTGESLHQFLVDCISAVRSRLQEFDSNGSWLGAAESDQETESLWRTTLVEEIVHILQMMFHQLRASKAIASGDLLLSWLDLMQDYEFLEKLEVPCDEPVELLLPLQTFVSLTTLAFLGLPECFDAILKRKRPESIPSGRAVYFLSKDTISKTTEVLVNASLQVNTVRLAGFAWGLLLNTMNEMATEEKNARELEQCNSAVDSFNANRRYSGPSQGSEGSLYEQLLERVRTPYFGLDEAIKAVTSSIVTDSVFNQIATLSVKVGSMSAVDDELTSRCVRLELLSLIEFATYYLDYSPELMESVLAVLGGTPEELRQTSTGNLGPEQDPKRVFVNSSILMERIFHIARSRFPYETVPFLRLCRVLANGGDSKHDGLTRVMDELENLDTFTQLVPNSFHGYETIREDENANFVSLTRSLPMIDGPSQPSYLRDVDPSNALVVSSSSELPMSTIGQVISESKPAVIMWQHQYSCLSYLGSWLEEWGESGVNSPDWDAESGSEMIGLLADLVASAQGNHLEASNGATARRLLETASDGLSRQGDIVSVVLDIFERHLQSIGNQGNAAQSLELIIVCVRFVKEVLKVLPGRVWPFFSRSSLIGADGKGGVMSGIISAMEIPSGEYPFLSSCVNLFVATIDDVATRAVLRKSPGSDAAKSTVVSDWSASIPSHVMRTIMLNFTRTMVDIYNSNANWRFNLPEQRLRMNQTLAASFSRMLYYTFGISDDAKYESKLTGVFSSSATYLLDILRPRSTADLPFNPLLRLITDGLQTPASLYLRFQTLIEGQVNSTLSLCTSLIQAARLAGQSATLLEEQLFKATPVLVKLYALHDAYRLPVVELLEQLVAGAASNLNNEPPSLVGHLGARSCCLFLDVLSQLDKPLADDRLLLSVWRLLATFVSKRQQWLAVFILTGASPRQTLKKASKDAGPAMRGTPFLQLALDKLANIDKEDPQVVLALLEFVSRAQENWPWATPHLKNHPQFFNSIVSYVSKLDIASTAVTDQIYVTRIAAVVADICAVYLHSAKESRDRSFIKTLIPLVQWYCKDAVDVSAYNHSLHANLKKNFESRYAGCKVSDFKRTSMASPVLGSEYYYDLGMGHKLLAFDFAWNGGRRNQGFSEEFARANINLSLVEAQVSLLHSWKFFAIEHCADFMPDRQIQRSMAKVVQDCLEANTRSAPPEAIFERIQQARVSFAQALLQRLVEVESHGAEVFGLLETVFKTLRACHRTYEEALISEDTEYYRSLLNVLFLSLQFHLPGPNRANPEALSKQTSVSGDLSVVVEIVKTVVAQGFKSLTTYLHDQPEKCAPKDFAIIIAILQSCLQVKNADRLYEHIAFHLAGNDVARHATTLFSWADQLTVAGDPIYGELSISILVKMSTLPLLAEHLAAEGAFMKLSTCRLTNVLRQPKGFGPFDPTPRLYTIWTSGILPLCLNLLHNVVRFAPEIAAFINQFEGQLTRASESFSTPHATIVSPGPAAQWISLSMTSEAYSLALISFILSRFREAGASAGLDAQAIQELKWDKMQVKEDIEELLGRRAALRTRIVATTEKEVEWSRQKPLDTTSGAETRLEEKVVAGLKTTLACLGGEDDA